MFTGIITQNGVITQALNIGCSGKIIIETKPDFLNTIKIGDSIAVDGVCLTVIEKIGASLSFDVSDETVAKTTLKTTSLNQLVNLEQALKFGDKLDGHLVQGHVDIVVIVDKICELNNNKIITLKIKPEDSDYLAYVAPKGSVTINGVSLTVNSVNFKQNIFNVNIIPHTLKYTNLDKLELGSRVNLEIDLFARYSVNYIKNYLSLINKEADNE